MSPTTRHIIRGIAALLCMTAGIALMGAQCDDIALNGLLVLAGVALVAVALRLCGGKKYNRVSPDMGSAGDPKSEAGETP